LTCREPTGRIYPEKEVDGFLDIEVVVTILTKWFGAGRTRMQGPLKKSMQRSTTL
jgi:hypothetical protein